MTRQHTFTANIVWTGNLGTGTSAYTAYSRNHTLTAEGKSSLACSSAPEFRGDATMYNPEDENQLASLHEKAHKHCFIANSLNCTVQIIGSVK